jgi:hypothetical protein
VTADWAHEFFRRIAVPRVPGSQAVANVESLVEERLRSFGFEVQWQSFSTAPHRLRAVAVAGAGFGWCALASYPLFVLPFPGWIVALTVAAALAAAALLAWGVARRMVWVDDNLVTARNLLAVKDRAPRFWLVAHSDSKGQRLSLRGRVVAFTCLAIGIGGLLALLGWRVAGPLPPLAVVPWIVLTLAGGAALSGPALVGSSPGAVDNASGIVAVLVAAERFKHRSDVGVLVTGAEEFGMEGARAWTTLDVASGTFVNFDGIDNVGVFNVMVHAPKGAATRAAQRPTAKGIRGSLSAKLVEAGYKVRPSRLPIGVFVDGSVLAAGGLGGVTVSRGSWATLGVVHRPEDTVERTDPESAIQVGRIVARVTEELFG